MVWSGATQTHGYVTLEVERELEKMLVWTQRGRFEHENDGHRHEVREQHNEENVVGIDATVLCRGLGWL